MRYVNKITWILIFIGTYFWAKLVIKFIGLILQKILDCIF